MKMRCALLLLLVSASVAAAAPIRVAVLDFDDQTGLRSDAALGGAIDPKALADKGVFLLGTKLLNNTNYVLIDRRDFISQIEKSKLKDMGEKTATRPTFLHAAQALNCDIVLRGTLMAFSTGKQMIDQGGFQTEFATLSARVGLQAIDAVDGSVVAMASDSAERSFRQTAAVKTVLSENDAVTAIDAALAKVLPSIEKALSEKQAKQEARPKAHVSIKTDSDPALVELDGILIGSTPLDKFEVYRGDHVMSITKPGFQQITKRILVEKDIAVEAPMIKLQLSADEIKAIVEKAKVNIVIGEPSLIIHSLE